MDVPDYIAERLRRTPPRECGVVQGAPPIISFGSPHKARVATLSLNPSHVEFSGGHMPRDYGDLGSAPDFVIQQVVEDQYAYFQRKPYRWFRRLEAVLNALGASYYDGSAAALDLVQWATDPVWSGLKKSARETLLAEDARFLELQLQSHCVSMLLVNGSAVSHVLSKRLSIRMAPFAVIEGLPGTARIPSTLLSIGSLANGVRVVAWNVNLQGTPGITDRGVVRIANEIAKTMNDLGPTSRS